MTKLVLIKLDGDFYRGFQVNVSIFLEGNRWWDSQTGTLPSAPQLLENLQNWQQEYWESGNNNRIKGTKVVWTRSHRSQLQHWGDKLTNSFHKWLRSDGFYNVRLWLNRKLQDGDGIRIIICADRQQVHQLPWNKWDFLSHYPQAEIAICNSNGKNVTQNVSIKPKNRLKILAIFGGNQNINLKKDQQILKNLEFTELEPLIKPLIKPQRQELYDCLWCNNWDLVFFAGHSKTIQEEGIIYLNDDDILTIADVEYAFTEAIANGLKLAIFNSCDGLGLAYALGKLGLSQMIVMREPIADSVAHQFLNYFLEEYKQNQPLHLATRRARERLQGLEDRYPYSSWLPVLYQNPAATPFVWSQLVTTDTPSTASFSLKNIFDPPSQIRYPVLGTAIAIILTWLLQNFGYLQAGELSNFDRALSLRPAEARDERILVITIDDQDIEYQQQQGMTMRWSLADEALAQLLTKLQPYQPVAIASDLIHDFPYQPQLQEIMAQTDNFVGICRVESKNNDLKSIKPPPDLTEEQLGFTNMAMDADGVIRRQIIGMTPDETCLSNQSLSLRMALKYLDYIQAQNQNNNSIYPRELKDDNQLVIGTQTFPRLQANSGAYKLPPTENNAYQILMNYRYSFPQTITLQEILTEKSSEKLENLVKEKLIFIGVKSHNSDKHYTPYSLRKQSARVPGVFIHAQASSQIISAVLDKRILIRWFPDEIEFLWLVFWSFVGSVISLISQMMILRKQNFFLIIFITIFCALFTLYFSYFQLLIAGYWLPLIAPSLAFLLTLIISLLTWKKSNLS